MATQPKTPVLRTQTQPFYFRETLKDKVSRRLETSCCQVPEVSPLENIIFRQQRAACISKKNGNALNGSTTTKAFCKYASSHKWTYNILMQERIFNNIMNIF